MKVYYEDLDIGGCDKQSYNVKNAREVLEMELCSGDLMEIDGIGKLEIVGLLYKAQETGENPYRSLLITCVII